MSVSAAQVKELRERTGAGMMECKKALIATHGDIKLAVEELRKSGIAKADKKAGRVAAEGVVRLRQDNEGKTALLIEVNSETDFVARDENFINFVNTVADVALQEKAVSVETLASLNTDNGSIEDARRALVAKVGENIHVRRLARKESTYPLGSYLHGSRIGVLVELDSDNAELAKDIAMHIAATRPICISPEDVSSDIIAKEKEIYMAQAASSGKPQDIIEKMVAGRIKKYLDEVSLLGQPFVKDPNITIASLLNKHRTKVLDFIRFEVGEGIEKEAEDFVEAVRAQVQGNS